MKRIQSNKFKANAWIDNLISMDIANAVHTSVPYADYNT